MNAIVKTLSVAFRSMKEEDLSKVMLIEREVYKFPWTEQIFKDCLRVGYRCKVAEVDDQLVAYAIMSTGAGEAHILNLCVSPPYQGKGVGRQLMLQVLVQAKNACSVDSVFLEVRPSNLAAIKLYQALGFNEVGIRKNYYPTASGREDALILALNL